VIGSGATGAAGVGDSPGLVHVTTHDSTTTSVLPIRRIESMDGAFIRRERLPATGKVASGDVSNTLPQIAGSRGAVRAHPVRSER